MPYFQSFPVVVALGQPQPGQPSVLVQMLPFALMLGVFYFLVLLPMRRRQKKIQEFQAGLKVGDKVITTAGIFGQITKISDNVIQIQIAEKVRIDVARASVAGYEGQEPVVKDGGGM